MRIGLVTGGRWHNEPYLYLKQKGIKLTIFDDSPKCYLKRKYNISPLKLSKMKIFKNIIFWSPCNDKGSALSDYYNKKNNLNVRIRSNRKNLEIFDKKIYANQENQTSYEKKKYLLKSRFGSGSKNINFWGGEKYNKKKFYLEKFFNGFELSVEMISIDGIHNIFAYSLRIIKKIKSAIALVSLKNSKKFNDYLLNTLTKHLNKYKIINGVTHVELIIDKKKKIKIIDTNTRCPGAGLTDYYYKLLTRQNLFEIDYKIILKNLKKIKKKFDNNHGLILYDDLNSSNFEHNLKKYSKKIQYFNLEFEKKKNKDKEVDSNRKGLAIIRFKNKNELLLFSKNLFKKKDYNLMLNYFSFVKKNF